MGGTRRQHHKPQRHVVRHVQRARGAHVQAREGRHLAEALQPLLHLVLHVGLVQLLGAVLHHLAQRGARVVPVAVAAAVAVQEGGLALQRAQRVVEDGDVLAGLHGAQADVRALYAARGLAVHVGRGAQHDGARYAPRSQHPPVARVLLVVLVRDGLLAVNLGVNDAVPVLVQVARQLVAHVGHVQRQGAGHDHGALVAAHPQLVDDGGHQAQHATRALEGLQRGPVLVQAVEHLGVDGVAAHHAVAILQLARVHGEVRRVLRIHLAEGVAHLVALGLVLAVEEESSPHHLKALVRADGLPDCLHAAKGVLNGLQRALAALAANLPVALGDGRHNQAALARARRLGQLLDEGDEVVEGAGGQLVHAIELLRVGNQLVHQHQRAAARVEHLCQRLGARRYAPAVGVAHVLVQLGLAGGLRQLVGNLAPDGVDGYAWHGARTAGLGGVEGGAHDHCHVDLGDLRYAGRLENRLHVGDALHKGAAAQQVVQSQHAVRLAAAKGRLQLNHGLAVQPRHAPQGLHQQPLHSLRHVGTAEELHRVAVLQRALATRHLRQVRRELRVAVAALRHVLVGLHHVAPARQAAHGHRLRRVLPGGGLGRVRVARGGNGALGAAVARLPQQGIDFGRPLAVNLVAQAAHGVQRAPGVVLGEVLHAAVCPLHARALQLYGPGAAVARELPAEDLVPLEVNDAQACQYVERAGQLAGRASLGKVPPLLRREVRQHALGPPALAVGGHKLLRDVGHKGVEQDVEALGHLQVVLHAMPPTNPWGNPWGNRATPARAPAPAAAPPCPESQARQPRASCRRRPPGSSPSCPRW